jgi:WhiB family redox-sensing transcriptional regulator
VTPVFDPAIVDLIERERISLPCWEVDPDLFFAETPEEVENAKAVCVDCPIRIACLAAALTRAEPWGVWGGELVVTGVVVPRKRPRGRPRKHVVVAA